MKQRRRTAVDESVSVGRSKREMTIRLGHLKTRPIGTMVLIAIMEAVFISKRVLV